MRAGGWGCGAQQVASSCHLLSMQRHAAVLGMLGHLRHLASFPANRPSRMPSLSFQPTHHNHPATSCPAHTWPQISLMPQSAEEKTLGDYFPKLKLGAKKR